jgi:hypothetical protein
MNDIILRVNWSTTVTNYHEGEVRVPADQLEPDIPHDVAISRWLERNLDQLARDLEMHPHASETERRELGDWESA